MSIRKKRNIFSLIALAIILILGPLAYFRFIRPKLATASWFDDKFYFRTAITITNSGSADANKKVKFDIDTATLYSAGKIKINCDDSRFTDTNGKQLQYYLDSANGACNTNSTDYYVLVPVINAGTTIIYHYYGNPSATKGSQNAQFSQATFSQDATSTSTEEQSKAPIAYWSFNEGFGTTVNDSTSNRNNGTLGAGSSAPTWQTEDMCVSGKCLYFGGNDFVSIGNTAKDVKTISFWVKPTTTSQNFIDLDGGTHYISDSSGVVSATGFTTPTIYVNGRSNGTLTANNWNHVEVTTDTSFNASSIKLGRRTTNYLTGFMDEVKIYPYARSAAEVKADYNAGKSHATTNKGSSASLGGSSKQSEAFSEGLVGYWKMEENTGTTVADSSGNSNTVTLGTGNSAPGWSAGMYGIGMSFDGSNDYISTAYSSSLKLGNNATVSLWYKPSALDSGTHPLIIYGDSSNYNNGYLLNQNGSSLTVYWKTGGPVYSLSNVFTIGIWTHIVMTNNNGVISVYKNSQNITPATTSVAPGGAITGNYATSIGGVVPGWLNVSGIIDELRIYNRALSPAEVQQLYNWAPGPVVYYDFNLGTGTAIPDKSGNNINGTVTLASITSWQSGKYGKAITFNPTGYNGGFTFPQNSRWVFGLNDFTIETWIYRDLNNGNDNYFLGNYPHTAKTGVITLDLSNASPAALNFLSRDSAGTYVQRSNLATLSDKTWNHIALTRTNITTLTIYINGVLTTTTTTGNSGNYDWSGGDGIFHLGYGGGGNCLTGKLDEFKIYNYARTQKQIVEDMNAGHPAGGSPVGSQVAKYSLDEGYGTSTNNSISGGVSLTLGTGASAPSWNNDGKFGKALSFDGGGDFAYTANTALMAGAGQTYPTLAVSTWVYPQTSAASKTIIHKNNEFKLTTDANSKPNCSIYAGGSWQTAAVGSTALTLNSWQHVLCNYDGANIKVWINGANKGSQAETDQLSSFSSTALYIARDSTTAAGTFQGLIDDIKIYNYSLSADEIYTDFNSGSALVLGSLSSGTGNTAPNTAASQEYCIPGDTATCSPPVGRWDFNEGVGSSAYDSSGNGNNGAWNGTGTHWGTGKYGKAGKFNGSNDKVNAGTGISLDVAGQMTAEAWFKVNGDQNGMFFIDIGTDYVTYWWGWRLYYFANGDYLTFNWGDGSYPPNTLNSPAIILGKWYHLAVTLDGVKAKIYFNGSLVSQANQTEQLVAAIDNQFSIGDSGSYFNGLLDDVRIYNYARTPAQIAWDYNRGKPVAWYDFDECQGATIHNSQLTINNLDGTLTVGANGTQNTAGTCSIGVGQSSAWYNGATGKYNASLNFDGTDDYVSVGTGSSVNSVSFWVKPTTNTASMIQLATGIGVTASSGVITTPGFTSPAIYVNGIPGRTLTASSWQMITVTSATAVNPSAVRFGLFGSTYYSGQMDEVKIWNYALTATQIKNEYNQSSAVRFGPSEGNP